MSKFGNELIKIGLERGEDVKHSVKAGGFIEPDEYHEKASDLTDLAIPFVLELGDDLKEYADKWNPGGFMVFPIGIHSVMGTMRLHVYPGNMPERTAQGPNIHDHAWHLYSRVLTGTYRDAMYEIEELPAGGHDDGSRLYRTQRGEGGKDSLVTDGKPIKAVLTEERVVPSGQSHFIPAGTYHIPTVPESDTVATLVMDSHAFNTSTGVVFKNKPEVMQRQRVPLSVGDIALAQNILFDIRSMA